MHWICVWVFASAASSLPLVCRGLCLRASEPPSPRRGSRALSAAAGRTGSKRFLQRLRRHHSPQRGQRRTPPGSWLRVHRCLQGRWPQVRNVARCCVVSADPSQLATVGVASMKQRPNPSIEGQSKTEAQKTTARLASAVIVSLAAFASTVHAQTFPSKSLRIIVPFPPGGAADITSRLLGEHMAKGLGQAVIAENRPGAGAVIGDELAARATGDGHTMLVGFPSFVINPSVKPGLRYDPLRDFKAVGQTISVPMVFAGNPSVPANSLEELVALARAKPGTIAYGTPGAGTTHHVIGETFRLAAKVNIVHAPFQGGGPAITAAGGGHIPMGPPNVSEVVPFATAGTMRRL